ncbi:MAG: DUF3784 domain-containing protein [Romboutsia sp.]|uniref:DUF3784 domain-containing protein n=1 Tax=Romboutsia sp. TaxID=1965302 RepID=UPI003F3AFDE2
MLKIALLMSCALFFVSGMFFLLKDKASILINGYYFISKNERELYDELKLSRDYGVILLKLALILLVGAIGYILISKLVLWISVVIWIVYFVKVTVTFRFDKYKINPNN